MPWIEKRLGGYVVRWRDGGRGTPAKCSPIIIRKDLALAKAAEIGAAIASRGTLRAGMDLPMAEVLIRWKTAKIASGGRSLNVTKTYDRLVSMTKANDWGTCRKVTPESIQQWRESGGSPRSGACLRAVLRWAHESIDQGIDDRSLVALRPRPVSRRPRSELAAALQVENWQRLADEAGPSTGALVHCLATYGWRPITAADLLVKDLDLKAGRITTSVKGGDVVRHPLLEASLVRLRPLVVNRKRSDPLFLHPVTGKAWNPDSASAGSIICWCRDYLRAKSYDLKRWAISGMLTRKMEPQTVALFTGHRTISQVLTYARTNEERARVALALLEPPDAP